ncbi:alpha/beta hydrolase [Saccharomonospora iraqiensis]|uniref:alpha/beta hydrolase n=1 Tax=Saccharomonospora iraqiensis TaxID=52698 RepID=UPI00022E0B3F|nr:alpha/beta hydrolase [Saccharomonospora iraqiensis]
MATFALVHGSGDGGWYWHLVERELRRRGHDTVAPDLPTDDGDAGLRDYADAVVAAVARRDDVVVVAQSSGGFVAPLVAETRPVREMVLVAGMIPAPGETPNEWFGNTGYADAVREAAERDGGLTGSEDPYVAFLHDVPRALADEAMRRERPAGEGSADEPWPLAAWPDVPTRYLLCTGDRFFPPALMRRLAAERLGITDVEEIAASHTVALSRPTELADLLVRGPEETAGP